MRNTIKSHREGKKITQEQLARLIDISNSQMYKIEAGKTKNTNIEIAIKIKRILNIKDIEELFIIE